MFRAECRTPLGEGVLGDQPAETNPAESRPPGHSSCPRHPDNLRPSAKGKLKGKPVADPALRDTENVPLTEGIAAYFEREVKPHAPHAWIDEEKTKVGYEIPFNRHFYNFRAAAVVGGD
jgi:hypothetical protein